jgi:hypothetical protein
MLLEGYVSNTEEPVTFNLYNDAAMNDAWTLPAIIAPLTKLPKALSYFKSIPRQNYKKADLQQ